MSYAFPSPVEWSTNGSMTTAPLPTSTIPMMPTPAMYTAAATSTAMPSTLRHSVTKSTDRTTSTNVTGQLVCEWDNCQSVFSDPTTLYRHLCDEHIGRFRQGNRCLECRWRHCGVTTVKRDHITSHLKVHVPFRPFECEICGSTFKRSHDLKKHVKRHARSLHISGSVELRRQPHKSTVMRNRSNLLETRSASGHMGHSTADLMLLNGYNPPSDTSINTTLGLTSMAPAGATSTGHTYAPSFTRALNADSPLAAPVGTAATITAAFSTAGPLYASIPIHSGVFSPAPTPPIVSPEGPGYSSVTSSPSLLGLVDTTTTTTATTTNDKRTVIDALTAVAAPDQLSLDVQPTRYHSISPTQPLPSFRQLPPQSLPLPSSPPPSQPSPNQTWVTWPATSFPQVANNSNGTTPPNLPSSLNC